MPLKNKLEISNRLFIILIVFLVGLSTFWSFRVYEIYQQQSGDYPREITVEGEGKAYMTPDVAKINLGVSSEAKTSEAVVEANTKIMNAVMEAVRASDIPEEDIRTTGYYLNPKYEWNEKRGSYQDGYILDQNIEVKIRDFEQIGKLLSATTAAGANTVGGIQFVVDDAQKAKDEAREDAIAKAKEKAETIASQAGLKLGKVLNYYEYSDGYGSPMPYRDMAFSEESFGGESIGLAVPEIEPGLEEVSLTVNLTYRLK